MPAWLYGHDITLEVVRHPSYGGQAEFISGVNHICAPQLV
jgi:hypothetical protein